MVVKSSIMERTNNKPLSIELLREHVPAVQAGQQAREKLADPKNETTLTPEEKRELKLAEINGTKAQRILILSGLPLIKRVASKELQRRSAWGSRISYDDILQEAIAGFIRGLIAFKTDVDIKSPTNYLVQWINTSIRRNVEAMDHDFNIPHETIERHRRMKAVHSRLVNDLEREPTDDEFVNALNSVEYSPDSSKWGRGLNSEQKSKKVFTYKHVEEMREIADKVYPLKSVSASENGDEENEFERNGKTLTSVNATIDTVEDSSLSTSQYIFFQKAFHAMNIGTKQRDVISRTFGLKPYESPQIVRVISENTGLTQRMVKHITQSFSQYISLKGGIFHYLISELSPQEVEDIEFGWIIGIVGEYPTNQRKPSPPPSVLTDKKV